MATPNRTYSPIGSIVFTLIAFFLLFSSRPGRGATTAPEIAPEPERQAKQPPTLRIAGAGQGGGNDKTPLVSLSFPGDDSQRQRDEAAYMRDRLADLLTGIGMERIGGPLFEEEGDEVNTTDDESGSERPAYKDPYVVDQVGSLIITTWGGIYPALSSTQIEGGQCNA